MPLPRLLLLRPAERGFPAPRPAGQLPFEIAVHPPQPVEPDLGRIDPVQIGERIDQRKADAAVELGPAGELRGDVVADHKPAAPLLDDEDRADDALVLA